MALGMVLCGLAFAMSGFLELQLEKTYPVMPKAGEGQLRIFNGQSCGFQMQTNLPSHEKIYLAPNSAWTEKHIAFKENETLKIIQYNITTEPGSTCEPISFNGDLNIYAEKATSYLLAANNTFVQYEDSIARSKSTLPLLRILITSWVNSSDVISKEIMIQNMINSHSFKLQSDLNKLHEVEVGNYFVGVDGIPVGEFELKHNGAYAAVITQISQFDYVRYDLIICLKLLPIHFKSIWIIKTFIFCRQWPFIRLRSLHPCIFYGKYRNTWLLQPVK